MGSARSGEARAKKKPKRAACWVESARVCHLVGGNNKGVEQQVGEEVVYPALGREGSKAARRVTNQGADFWGEFGHVCPLGEVKRNKRNHAQPVNRGDPAVCQVG